MKRVWGLLLPLLFVAAEAVEDEPLRFSADRYATNLKTKIVEAQGNVKVYFDDFEVTGDELRYSPADGALQVTGNVDLKNPRYAARAKKLDYNLTTKEGKFFSGRLRHSRGMIIEAVELEALGDNRFKIYQGKLTTCEDCPPAWSFSGAYIDLTLEGYAEIHHALLQIKDLPLLYLPLFILPVKTKRQSGFLFPNYAYSSRLGPQVAQAYYWAPTENFDDTFEYRYFTRAGSRFSNELRYRYSNRSFVDFRSSYVNNSGDRLPEVGRNRYGLQIDQRYQITPTLTQRWRGEWASDSRYIQQFEGNRFNSYQQATVLNEPSLTWQSDHSLFLGRVALYQDNLPRLREDSAEESGLGPIDVLPHLMFTRNSTQLLGPIRSGGDLELLSLRRSRNLPDPETGWYRAGDRASVNLRLSSPMNVADALMWDPLLELRGDAYRLEGVAGADNSAVRGRIATEQRVSTQFYRVYHSQLGNLRALRHSFTPSVRWSYAPADWRSDHAFFSQRHTFADGRGTVDSPRFDLFDPRPRSAKSDAVFTTADDESRLHQHNLLTLGVSTDLVGRFGEDQRRYERFVRIELAQDYDLYTEQIGLLRLGTILTYGPFYTSYDLIFDTRSEATSTRSEFAYDTGNWRVATSYRKSKSVNNLTATISSPNVYNFGVYALATYDFQDGIDQFVRQRLILDYKSGSKCWFFSLDLDRYPDRDKRGRDTLNINPKIGLVVGGEEMNFRNAE